MLSLNNYTGKLDFDDKKQTLICVCPEGQHEE
jgi:hypothetical protein